MVAAASQLLGVAACGDGVASCRLAVGADADEVGCELFGCGVVHFAACTPKPFCTSNNATTQGQSNRQCRSRTLCY